MYYFAYGSNMNIEHMRKLCGWHFTVLGVATLEGYHLSPDFRGYINIKPSLGSKVMGVLYSLDQHALDALDEFEGYPNVFNRHEVKVTDYEGDVYSAYVYLETENQFGGAFVKEEYLNRVILGAKENHLPQEWVEFLESFEKK